MKTIQEIKDFFKTLKAIAVFGDTKPLKEKFKAIGGRFNPFLTNNGEKMAGWIFPVSKSAQLSLILN